MWSSYGLLSISKISPFLVRMQAVGSGESAPGSRDCIWSMQMVYSRTMIGKGHELRRLACLAAILGIGAAGMASSVRSAAGSVPSAEASVPFRVGETLTYDVGWSSYLTAGTVIATVKEKKPSYDSTAYYIVIEGRPTPFLGRLYPVYYKLDALLDSSSLLSQ